MYRIKKDLLEILFYAFGLRARSFCKMSHFAASLPQGQYLVEHEPDSPLVDMLAAKIDAYEGSAPEFAAFNERIPEGSTGVALLRTLMEQQGLKQTGFAEEIGQRSLVSRIRKGERTLTLDHMRKLTARFGLPVSSFVD